MDETKKIGWGGARKGAGRKAPGAEAPLTAQVVMRITPATAKRIKYLRMFTAGEEVPFNRKFENWVKEEAEKIGIKVE